MPPQLPVCLLVISACCPKDSDDIQFFNENFQLSGIVQYVDGRNDSKTLDDVTLFGARVQVNF